MTAFYVFTVNLQTNCTTYKFFYDSATYCFRSSQCDSFDIYIYNLGVNLFPITLYILQIIETLIVHASPTNNHELSNKYSLVGMQLSKIFTSLVDMHSQQTVVLMP